MAFIYRGVRYVFSAWRALTPAEVISFSRSEGISVDDMFDFADSAFGGDAGVDQAIAMMETMAGNEGQLVILTDYVPDPFREFFESDDFFDEYFNFVGHMRSAIGEDKYDAVDEILREGYSYVDRRNNDDMPFIPFV